jgi:hypothetical protein
MSIDETNDVLNLIPSIVWPIGILLVITPLIGGILFGSFQQKRLARISHGLKQIAGEIYPFAWRRKINETTLMN